MLSCLKWKTRIFYIWGESTGNLVMMVCFTITFSMGTIYVKILSLKGCADPSKAY